MKIFGGGGSPHHSNHSQHEDHRAKKEAGEGPAAAHGPTAPKPVKKTLTKKQKRTRLAIIIIAVTLAIIAVMCAAAAVMMRPPSVSEENGLVSKPIRPESNNATINDEENGDEMKLDEGVALDVEMGNRREGVYTVLVAATDIDGTRTDALMVATLDTVNDTVNVINIPRDLMSSCNRIGASKKINAAYGTRGGIDTTKSEVKKVLGFTPDKYVVVSFQAIAEIIDAIGGVDYEIPWRMKYDDPTQKLHIDFQPGQTHLDGQAAVEFMRWRKNNSGVRTGSSNYTGGDEQRIEKDQAFLKHLAKEVFTLKNVPRIPAFAQAVFKNVETDLTAGEVLWLGWRLYDVKNENINMMTVPGFGSMSTAGTGESFSFYFPYRSQTLEMVNEFINPYEKAITSIDIVSGPTRASKPKKTEEDNKSEEKTETDAPSDTENPDGGDSAGTTGDGTGTGDAAGTTGTQTPDGTDAPDSSGTGEQGTETDAPTEQPQPVQPQPTESLFGPPEAPAAETDAPSDPEGAAQP